MNKEYGRAIEQAKENLKDANKRGSDAVGECWDDVQKKLFTPEEIEASNLRVPIIGESIKAKKKKETNRIKDIDKP